jgi:hypothetical protein
VIEGIKMVPSGIKFGKEQLNVLAYADDIVLTGKNEIEMTSFCRNRKYCQKVRTTEKPRKNKIYDSGMEKQFKPRSNRTINNKKLYILKSGNFKYLGVIFMVVTAGVFVVIVTVTHI